MAASAIGSAAGEHPGAVNMILVGELDIKSNMALMAAPLSHCGSKQLEGLKKGPPLNDLTHHVNSSGELPCRCIKKYFPYL